MRRRLVMLPGLVLVGCLIGAACDASSPRSDSEDRTAAYASNGTFSMAIKDDMGAFDPYRKWLGGYGGLAYDSLVKLRPNGKFATSLAQTWTVDTTRATFTLRPGVTCSDGTPLKASHVAADLTFLGDPKNQSPQYGVTVPTVPFTVTGDDATRTVKITMKSPFGFLLNTIGQAPIMCQKGLKNPKVLESGSDGTGPFVLTGYVAGQSYTFTRREGYTWGPDGASTSAPGTPAKVVLKVIANETTAANLLLSGELNFASVSGEDRRRLDARGLKKIEEPFPGAWLWFNQMGNRPTADKRVRQALVQSLDLEQVIKVNTGGAGSAATGLIPLEPRPCTADTVAGQLPKHDVAGAESSLDQAGWVKGADGTRRKDGKPLSMDLHYWSAGSLGKPTVEFIAQQWTAIGVQVRIKADSTAELTRAMYQTGNWDALMSGFGLALPNQMVQYLSGPVPPKGTNLAGINNRQYNTLVAKAATLMPPDACKYWEQAERALFQNIDVVPIATGSSVNYVKGAEVAARGYNLPYPTSIRMLR